jgi:hypothetical protein
MIGTGTSPIVLVVVLRARSLNVVCDAAFPASTEVEDETDGNDGEPVPPSTYYILLWGQGGRWTLGTLGGN